MTLTLRKCLVKSMLLRWWSCIRKREFRFHTGLIRTAAQDKNRCERKRNSQGVTLKFPRKSLIWALRIPAFAGALSLYAITTIVLAVMIHGWRAPLTVLSLLPRIARLLTVRSRRLVGRLR